MYGVHLLPTFLMKPTFLKGYTTKYVRMVERRCGQNPGGFDPVANRKYTPEEKKA